MPTLVYRDTGVIFQRIRQESPTAVFSGGETETPIEAASTSHNRVIGEFPMVPPGGTVTVTSATLTLSNLYAVPITRTVQMRRVVTDWVPAQTSWANRTTNPDPWATPGVVGSDTGAVIATVTAPTGANTAFNITGAGLVTYCQDVLNGGTDFGFLLNLVDDLTISDPDPWFLGGTTNATATRRPTLTIDYTTGTPVNWTMNSPTVNSDAGTVTLTVTLDAPAPGGGFSGLVNTYDITAVAGVDYTAQVAVPFSISAGNTTGNIVIPILP